jgi:hypothetical protein
MLSGGAGWKYLHLIAGAQKASPSASQWKTKPVSAFAVKGMMCGECMICGGEVGVSYRNNSFACHNV